MKIDAAWCLFTLSICYAIRLQNSVPELQNEKRRINRKINTGESSVNLGGSTLEVLRSDGSSKSKTLLLYTTSGDPRHLESLCLNAALLQREGIPDVLRDIDVLVYDNSGTDTEGIVSFAKRKIPRGLPKTPIGPVISEDLAPPEERRRSIAHCLANFTHGHRNMYMSSLNIGYRMGAVQAMDILFKHQIFAGYDWVIHLHPDVFILNPFPLARTLTRSTTKDVITGRYYPRCYTFNFFAFRPHKVNKDGFSGWNTSNDIPECYLRRVAFKDVQSQVNIVGHNGERASVHTPRLSHMDRFGMWHHHDTSVIRKELRTRPTLVNVTGRDFKIDTISSETDAERNTLEGTSSHEISDAGL